MCLRMWAKFSSNSFHVLFIELDCAWVARGVSISGGECGRGGEEGDLRGGGGEEGEEGEEEEWWISGAKVK